MTGTVSQVAWPAAASSRGTSSRDAALDFVKGALVAIMVVYHTMNVFSTAGPEAYRPIRFVSGSFVFIAGFIVARFQLDAFRADWQATSRRLFERGVKLLLVFTALNLAIHVTGIGNPAKLQGGVREFIDNAYAIYVLADARRASFQILLPIAYLFMIAPAVLALHRLKLLLLAAALAFVLALQWLPAQSAIVDFTLIGIVGIAAGMVAHDSRSAFVIRNRIALAGSLALAFVAAGAMSAQPFTYLLSIMLIVKLLYDAGSALGSGQRIASALATLGRYSLVAYIAQIVLLRGSSLVAGRPKWELGASTVGITLATCIVLWIMAALLDLALARSPLAMRCYRAVFS